MGIEKEFLVKLKETHGSNFKRFSEVDWSTISQEALDDDSFRSGEPFYLIAPFDYWQTIRESPEYRQMAQCLDYKGNQIPGCTPPSRLTPLVFGLCVNIADGSYNAKLGRDCMRQGDNWYQVTCFVPCL